MVGKRFCPGLDIVMPLKVLGILFFFKDGDAIWSLHWCVSNGYQSFSLHVLVARRCRSFCVVVVVLLLLVLVIQIL